MTDKELEEIKRITNGSPIARWSIDHLQYMSWCRQLVDEIESLIEDNKVMREALAFYADERNYEYEKKMMSFEIMGTPLPSFIEEISKVEEDEGKKAREALERVKDD